MVGDARLMLVNDLGPFHLWKVPPRELSYRLERAWQRLVACQMKGRQGFAGLDACNIELTRHWVPTMDQVTRATVRVAQNGTDFTMDAVKHMHEGVSGACKHCGEADSMWLP